MRTSITTEELQARLLGLQAKLQLQRIAIDQLTQAFYCDPSQELANELNEALALESDYLGATMEINYTLKNRKEAVTV